MALRITDGDPRDGKETFEDVVVGYATLLSLGESGTNAVAHRTAHLGQAESAQIAFKKWTIIQK